jgi:hypothetical protein
VVGLRLTLKVKYQNGGNFSAKFMNILAMGPRTELSYADRTRIMCWLQEKIPNSEIAARLGRHSSTILKATDRERKRLKDFVQRFPFKTAREYKANALAGTPSPCVISSTPPAKAPGSSVQICCQETPADGGHEEEKAVICQEVSSLD